MIHDGDHLIIETEWLNVDLVLDANKSAQADFSRTSGLGEVVHVAEIPKGLYWDWHDKGILDDDVALSRHLNDSDYRHLRTNSLRV
jgi:hypothetical protein